jgi:hypothetical protein
LFATIAFTHCVPFGRSAAIAIKLFDLWKMYLEEINARPGYR